MGTAANSVAIVSLTTCVIAGMAMHWTRTISHAVVGYVAVGVTEHTCTCVLRHESEICILLAYDLPLSIDIDECLTDNGGCSQNCTNTDGGYICECLLPGYDVVDVVNCSSK